MSTHTDLSGDSGQNHLKPFLAAAIACAIIGLMALALSAITH